MGIYIKNLEAMPCCEFCGFCRPYRGDPFSDVILCNAVNKLITLKAGICTPKPDWCPVIDTPRSVSEYDTGYAKLMYDAADAIEELSSLVSPYCGTCRTCKLAHSVEVRGKKLLLCDFTERVVAGMIHVITGKQTNRMKGIFDDIERNVLYR